MFLTDLKEKDFSVYYLETFGTCEKFPGKVILLRGRSDAVYQMRMLNDDKKEIEEFVDMTGIEWEPLYLDDGYYNALKTVVTFQQIRKYQRAVSTSDKLNGIGVPMPSKLRLLDIMREEKYCSSLAIAVKSLQSPSIRARAITKEYAIMRPAEKNSDYHIYLYGDYVGNVNASGDITLLPYAYLLKEELESL